VIARSARLGGNEDPDVAAALRAALESESIRFITSAQVERVQHDTAGVDLLVSHALRSEWLRATHLFVAAGRRVTFTPMRDLRRRLRGNNGEGGNP